MLDRGLMMLKEGTYTNQSTGKGQMFFANKLLDEK